MAVTPLGNTIFINQNVNINLKADFNVLNFH